MLTLPLKNVIPLSQEGGILKMLRPRSVWISWKEKRKRWEVGVSWHGKKERFYQYDGMAHTCIEIATDHAGAIRSEIKKGFFNPENHKKRRGGSSYLFGEYAKLWMKEYEQKIKTGDVCKEYVKILSGYIYIYVNSHFGFIDIREIQEPLIKQFYLSLSEKALSKKHVQNIMDAFKKMLSDAYQDHIILEMPRFPRYREKKRKKNVIWLTEKEQDRVLEEIEPIHKPIVMCLFYHGLRMAEIRDLKRSNLKANILQVATLKGGPDREIIIDDRVLEVIKRIPVTLKHQYLFHWGGRPYSKTKLWKIFREALDKAGFEDITPTKAVRHSVASQLYQRGAPTPLVQYILGHADSRTTEIYSHTKVEEQERVRRK